MAKNPFVSIVIVNWNGKPLLDDCLGSVAKLLYKNYEVVFVDNASTDDSVGYVKKKFPKVRIISTKKNFGYAEGNTVGFNHSKGDAILFLSNDTLVEKDLLSKLVGTLYEEKNIGAVMPKILIYPDKHKIDSVGSNLLASGFLYHRGHNKPDTKKIKREEIFSMKGACMLFKREVLKRIGIFDPDYFAYFEETDLCHRTWLAGYRILVDPRTAIYHKGGKTSTKFNYYKIQFHSFKNRIATYIKNLEIGTMIWLLPVHIAFCEVVSIAYFFTGQFHEAWAIQRAFWWNIVQLKQTLQKRKHVQQNIRTVTDDSFIPQLTTHVKPSYYFYLFTGNIDKYKD